MRLAREAGLAEPWCQAFVPSDNAFAEQLATDIFVRADIQAEFVQRFSVQVGALRVGDPLSLEIEVLLTNLVVQ